MSGLIFEQRQRFTFMPYGVARAAWRYSPPPLTPLRLRPQYLWQPGKVHCNRPRLIFAEQLCRRPPTRLIFEIDIGQPASSLTKKQASRFFDGPKAAGHASATLRAGRPLIIVFGRTSLRLIRQAFKILLCEPLVLRDPSFSLGPS